VEFNIALSRRLKFYPNRLSLIALLLNIITSINIRLPNYLEVVKGTKVIMLVIS